jgi:hypothetical protein
VPALQGLDRHGLVLCAGSFSKVMFPSLRLGIKENTLPLGTYPTQSGTARVPRVAECAATAMAGRYSSEIRTGCANQRPSGSVRGAPGNWCPYRDRQRRTL